MFNMGQLLIDSSYFWALSPINYRSVDLELSTELNTWGWLSDVIQVSFRLLYCDEMTRCYVHRIAIMTVPLLSADTDFRLDRVDYRHGSNQEGLELPQHTIFKNSEIFLTASTR